MGSDHPLSRGRDRIRGQGRVGQGMGEIRLSGQLEWGDESEPSQSQSLAASSPEHMVPVCMIL